MVLRHSNVISQIPMQSQVKTDTFDMLHFTKNKQKYPQKTKQTKPNKQNKITAEVQY